jgi:hypothetical protein
VDEVQVVVLLLQLGVVLRVLDVDVAIDIGEAAQRALQSVVHGLGGTEERLAARDQLPLRVDPEVSQ